MSIITAYDPDNEAVISPYDMVKKDNHFPEVVLVVFVEEFTNLLLKSVNSEVITYLSAGSKVPVYQFTYNNKKIGFYQSLIGGAAAGGMLEDVIAMGGRRFLFFGSCGVLNQTITSGHLIVPTKAYRDEGLSYHYVPASDYITIATANRMAAILDRCHVPYVKTKTWTTDAIYRETKRNMELRKKEGCAVVEMECASLMAVAQFRHVEVYQFLFAADCLEGENWDERILNSMSPNLGQTILQIALQAVITI